MTSVSFRHRRLNYWISNAPGLMFTAQRWKSKVIGGPVSATILASGDEQSLADLLQWTGYRARIDGDDGDPRWWGMVETVTARINGMTWVADLGEMRNRVAVAYTTLATGQNRTGKRATTEWGEEAKSIAEFGRRELLDSVGNTTAAYALARRNNRLRRRAYPRLKPKPGMVGAGVAEGTAKIECIGLWQTLEWVYARVPTSLVLAFQTIGHVEQTIGCDYNNDAFNVLSLAQSFDTGASAWNLQQAAIYIRRVGLPATALTISIAENPDDLTPGETLASATLNPGDVPTTDGWVIVTFDAAYLTTPNASYFLMVDFSGTPNQDNYYVLTLDGRQGYAAGVLRMKVEEWAAGPAADMPFRLYSNDIIENADQIRSMLIDNGQFMGRVHLTLTTGIATESFRNGDALAIEEIEQLLETGTSAGKRLLARVEPDWSVTVYEEPEDDEQHFLGADVNYYQGQALLPPESCPCGFWARTTGIRPINLEAGNLSESDATWVEASEYDAASGQLTGETDDEKDLLDVGDQIG